MMRAFLSAAVVMVFALQSGGGAVAGGPGRDDGPRVATAGQLIISEFRLGSTSGPTDEFIEIYNASGLDHTVAALSGSGYGVAASDGVTRCVIPNGTVIPNRGHYLCVNSVGYTGASYPAGNGTTATGNATYTTDIAFNAGIAIFNNSTGGGSYSLANRLDAAGSTSEANTTYREGSGLPPLLVNTVDSSYQRRPTSGCLGSPSPNCDSAVKWGATPPMAAMALADTNNNSADFIFSDPSGTSAGAGQHLGAAGPENLSSPVTGSGSPTFVSSRLDTCAAPLASPNQVRDTTPGTVNVNEFGTYEIRRRWTNNTGGNITRLRFRIVDISTFAAFPETADFRTLTSTDVSVTVDRPPCGTGTSAATVRGTIVETPPTQPFGSGYNASLSVGAVTLGTPLANGASVDVRFVIGVQQTGIGRFCVVPELLPAGSGEPFCFVGDTESDLAPAQGDFDFDQMADLPLYNAATGQWRILRSAGGYTSSVLIGWGGAGYVPVPADYDGDGRLDVAIYRESTGAWSVLTSSSNYTRAMNASWGGYGYVPVPGDYDGDGVADFAVYNATTSNWYVLTSSTSYTGSVTRSWGGNGYTPLGGQDFDGDRRSDFVIYQASAASLFVLKSSSGYTSVLSLAGGGPGWSLVPGDYDGDGIADFGVYLRAVGAWRVLTSSSGFSSTPGVFTGWGGRTFYPVIGDFDGDHKADLVVYQPISGKWFVNHSTTNYTSSSEIVFGAAGDVAVSPAVMPVANREIIAGDFDGDFRNDIAVYNTTSGVWTALKSSSGFTAATSTSWGGAGYSPAPGDYDGDGKGDLGLYQQSTGNWYVLLSSTSFTTGLSKSVGGTGWINAQGDYDGDNKTDFVVYNTTTGVWYGLKSSTGYSTTINVSWGGTGYLAVPSDYDADGKIDPAVYQPSTGNWLFLRSGANYTLSFTKNFGGPGYTAIPADFDGDGFVDLTVYQASTGNWSYLTSSTNYFLGGGVAHGGPGYTPVVGDWDGDGRSDIAVYTAAGSWSILLSGGNYTTAISKSWGGAGYVPVPVNP